MPWYIDMFRILSDLWLQDIINILLDRWGYVILGVEG